MVDQGKSNNTDIYNNHGKMVSFFVMCLQVGLDGISVFGTPTRTTSAVEAYNGVLGKMIPKQSNFFKFVRILQNQEFSKAREFELLANSGGALGQSKRKRQFIDKAEKIEKATKELQTGSITAIAFINRMVFPKNGTVTEMEPDEDIFEDNMYMQEEDDEEGDNINESSVVRTANSNLLCVVCLELRPNMLMMPCKHLKVCNICIIKLQADSIQKGVDKFKCPVCRQDVDDTLQVFL